MGAISNEPVGDSGAEQELWTRFKEAGDMDARSRLFAIHGAYARRLARRHQANVLDLEFEDLAQLAFEGLIEAIDRFDPGRGVPFRAYAASRINGNILDGITHASEYREQVSWKRRIRQERIRSLTANRDEPGKSALDALSELAAGLALGFMLEGTNLLQQEADPSEAQAQASRPAAYESLAWQEITQDLAQELERLGSREQRILKGHYIEGIAFDHIASLLGISKGRVSQLHKEALQKIRRRLASQGHFRVEN